MRKYLLAGAGLILLPMTVYGEPYTCEELGYVFEEGGCPDTSSMVRCPMNKERVWCIGGEMCGQYPVKGAACNDGAKIERCAVTENMDQAGKRCKYEYDICNQGWEKGVLKVVTGDSKKCCKEGWDLNPSTGVCEEHVCSKIRYPYTTDDYTYADYAGETETCKSGNVVNFGYLSCNNMWQRESENSSEAGYYKCLCKRTDYDNGYVFPFDKNTFYTSFGSGSYGDYHMCADAENSYYGYEHCYRGYEMQLSAGKKTGRCQAQGSYCRVWGRSFVSEYPVQDDSKIQAVKNSDYKCVYDGVCTAETQKYEECNFCIADASVVDGVHNVGICRGADHPYLSYIYKCPFAYQIFIGDSLITGKQPSSNNLNPAKDNYYGVCYGTCSWGSKDCRTKDIVLKDGKAVGLVLTKGSHYAQLVAYKKPEIFNKDNRTYNGVEYATGWDAAIAMAAAYAPSVCETGSGCEAGKWYLPDRGDLTYTAYAPYLGGHAAIIAYHNMFYEPIGATLSTPQWSSTVNTKGEAFQRSSWDGNFISKSTSNTIYAYPIVNMEFK